MEHISWQNPFINNGGPNFSSVMAMFGSSTIFQTFFVALCSSLNSGALLSPSYTLQNISHFIILLFFVTLKVSFWFFSLMLKWSLNDTKCFQSIILVRLLKSFSREKLLWLLKNHNFRCSAIENSNIIVKSG